MAFINNLLPPSQKARKLGLSAILITRPLPTVFTTTAAEFFIAALHNMGLVTLTHTPNPMKILAEILERPKNEEAMLLFPIGYPKENCEVPNLMRKSLAQVAVFLE